MVKEWNKPTPTISLLIFLLVLTCVVFISLYLELRYKNEQLVDKIEQLSQQQVLLMVPQQYAEQMSNWMSNHPEQTQALINLAKPNGKEHSIDGSNEQLLAEAVVKNSDNSPEITRLTKLNELEGPSHSDSMLEDNNGDVVLQGVKVITLPHGGIRVTTREDN